MDNRMNLYLLLAEDPFYKQQFVAKLLKSFPGRIVGAAFPHGFINKKNIFHTLRLWYASFFQNGGYCHV
jgi:hypothetical protein